MLKYIYYFLVALLICGCSGKTEQKSTWQMSVLRGPSAIAFAQWIETPPVINGKKLKIKVIDSPDLMQASLVKREPDIAVLPMINAANLYNKGVVRYHLTGCPIWGTLYMVEKNTIAPSNQALYVFGSGTTPDILTRYYLQKNHLPYEINYSFATAREITQALYIGKIERAVLSEPFLSIALQRDSTLHIIADLNRLEENTLGYAQTAILLAPSMMKYKETVDSLFTQSCAFAVEQPEEAIRILEEHKLFPEHLLTPKSIERCMIQYIPAAESKESIYRFLQLIYDYEPKAIGRKLPNDTFITNEI